MNILTNKWAYYNEYDPRASAWIRQLIKNKLITDGEVDERSIVDVEANDIRHFYRAHFFAGIAGWERAFELANYDRWDSRTWTASLPCQPFSVAGLGKGKDDERHLLPHFLELVRQCKPDTIFGEQVEGAIRHGWLDDLQGTMEAESYAVGHCVLGAHSVNAPHIRQRLYWVADNINKGSQGRLSGWQDKEREVINRHVGCCGADSRMGDTKHNGTPSSTKQGSNGASILGSEKRQDSSSEFKGTGSSGVISSSIWLGNTESNKEHSEPERGLYAKSGNERDSGIWHNPDWLYCRDNKYRPIKPGIEPLVDGISRGMVRSSDPSEPINANATQEARVMRLKGYGNAICAPTASAFIQAFMSLSDD